MDTQQQPLPPPPAAAVRTAPARRPERGGHSGACATPPPSPACWWWSMSGGVAWACTGWCVRRVYVCTYMYAYICKYIRGDRLVDGPGQWPDAPSSNTHAYENTDVPPAIPPAPRAGRANARPLVAGGTGLRRAVLPEVRGHDV